jgi:hypothetical protein
MTPSLFALVILEIGSHFFAQIDLDHNLKLTYFKFPTITGMTGVPQHTQLLVMVGVLRSFCPRWPQNAILPISLSWVARIAGMNYLSLMLNRLSEARIEWNIMLSSLQMQTLYIEKKRAFLWVDCPLQERCFPPQSYQILWGNIYDFAVASSKLEHVLFFLSRAMGNHLATNLEGFLCPLDLPLFRII